MFRDLLDLPPHPMSGAPDRWRRNDPSGSWHPTLPAKTLLRHVRLQFGSYSFSRIPPGSLGGHSSSLANVFRRSSSSASSKCKSPYLCDPDVECRVYGFLAATCVTMNVVMTDPGSLARTSTSAMHDARRSSDIRPPSRILDGIGSSAPGHRYVFFVGVLRTAQARGSGNQSRA